MKKISTKIISVILCICMIFGCSAIASSAETTDTVTRVSCAFNGDSQTSRGFCWYTETYTRSDVQIIKTSDFNGSYANATEYSAGNIYKFRDLYCHKVTVDNLEPGTSYTYRVGDRSLNLWSGDGTFRTDDGDSKFSFISIADVQASSDENFAHAAETMHGAVKTLPNYEFMINLGDFVNDDTNDEWNWYFKNFAFANMNTTIAPNAFFHLSDKV